MHPVLKLASLAVATLAALSPFNVFLLPSSLTLTLAQATDPRKTEADQLLKLCREQLQQQQYEAAIQSCQEAVASLRQRGNRNGEARSITNLGIAHLNRSQPEKAIRYFQQALPMFQAAKDRSGEAIVLTNQGAAYRRLSQYEQSVGFYEKALAIYQAVQNRGGEKQTLYGLGQTYSAMKRYDQALRVLEQALAIDREQQNRADERLTLETIAHVYDQMGQLDKAVFTRQQAVAIPQTPVSSNATDPRKRVVVASARGVGQPVHVAQKSDSEPCSRDIPLSRNLSSLEEKCTKALSLLALGETQLKNSEFSDALRSLEQVLQLSQKLGTRSYLIEKEALDLLGAASIQLGDLDEQLTIINNS